MHNTQASSEAAIPQPEHQQNSGAIIIVVNYASPQFIYSINGAPAALPTTPQVAMAVIDDLLKTGERHVMEVSPIVAEDLILRALRRVREKTLESDNLCIIYRDDADLRLKVSADGDLCEAWPGWFFGHRLDEMF